MPDFLLDHPGYHAGTTARKGIRYDVLQILFYFFTPVVQHLLHGSVLK